MALYIYNSLTQNKEPLEPLNPPLVNMYTCGVTVYDLCHIGHARSLYIFDVIRRYLEYRGFCVRFVRNITDIDDKIIGRARDVGTAWDAIAKKYTETYYEDLRQLGIGVADEEPKATGNIEDMKEHISGLIAKGFAYEVSGNVYFAVRKFRGYGELSHQGIDSILSGARLEQDKNKHDPLDFALWKRSKEGEPCWESPWGPGRPGWHIECSVMSRKFLGVDTLDIHAGGMDLIFPHHENERAQSEALTGRPFARHWIHHGLLTINGQKMSKSLGNFVTVNDFLAKYNDADLLKLFFLSVHYAHPIDYSEERIGEVKRAYERIDILLGKLAKLPRSEEASQRAPAGKEGIHLFKEKFLEYMDDDFNTPRALAVLFDMANACNKLLEGPKGQNIFILSHALTALKGMLGIFGLKFLQGICGTITASEIEEKIRRRSAYKNKRQFQDADRIRQELQDMGIILEDTKDGTTWRKKI